MHDSDSDDDSLLAQGGGNSTSSGVSFQAELGALFAAHMLAERRIDERLHLGDTRIRSLRFETEAPVDDILVETDTGGWVFVQAKTTLSLSAKLDSEFGKTAGQFVRQWLACKPGKGSRGWDRPLDPERDRLLIAVGPTAARTITHDLASALVAIQSPGTAPLPKGQRTALDTFSSLLAKSWEAIDGRKPEQSELEDLRKLTYVIQFDLDGADRQVAAEALSAILQDRNSSGAAVSVLMRQSAKLASDRLGTDACDLRRRLAESGTALNAPPSYQSDVGALQGYSDRVRDHLRSYETTRAGTSVIRVSRACTSAVVEAATEGSFLLIGEPGAGKSAVLSDAAGRLNEAGYPVLELAVDRLPVESLEGLRTELGLSHPIREVLLNWPGVEPAFLFIDALDASRGGPSDTVFRTLIEEVLSLPGGRWHVIASIRTFDLRHGQRFRELFAGNPVNSDYVGRGFGDVRHLEVPSWTETELDELLLGSPELATAIARGGERLRDLALVPFNTRLLADLITTGMEPVEFDQVASQVQLLDLYWRHRVEHHGSGAALCLRTAVEAMIDARALRADRLSVAKADAAALDNLLRDSVLITLARDRYVAFRHHLLFDYAASRVYLNPADISATAALLTQDRGLGLLLAPALGFVLQELWTENGAGRDAFWRAVICLAGDTDSDPVARSVAARIASELPKNPSDLGGILQAFGQPAVRDQAFAALPHIVGALTVRLEDDADAEIDPWPTLTTGASEHIERLVWSVRTLLFHLLERARTPQHIETLGGAARTLLGYAFTHHNLSPLIATAGIGFVGDTYASNPDESRRLLRLVFSDERFSDRAHEEAPWLARKASAIAEVDPDFLVEIYSQIFSRTITDARETPLGTSQILPLRSNAKQDYAHARYSLERFFPDFLKMRPGHAARALLLALEGHVALEHPIAEYAETWTWEINNRQYRCTEDGSSRWAWNPDDQHANDAAALLKTFVTWLRDADPKIGTDTAQALLADSRLAVTWARLFMVGAARPNSYFEVLWPHVIKGPFLLTDDTRKDAIDFIKAAYPELSSSKKAAFENTALETNFSRFKEADSTREYILKRLFGAIGAENLVTAEARDFVAAAGSGTEIAPNERPFQVHVSHGSPENWWWMRNQGVDVDAPENAALLERSKAIGDKLDAWQPPSGTTADIEELAPQLESLFNDMERTAKSVTHPTVTANAAATVAKGLDKISQVHPAQIKAAASAMSVVLRLTQALATHPDPDDGAAHEKSFETSAAWSPAARIDAAEAVINLCRVDTAIAEALSPLLAPLLSDAHPAVRQAVAHRLSMLWNTQREAMWQLVEAVAERETNRGVLRFFVGDTLGKLAHGDAERVESLTLDILSRAGDPSEEATHHLLEQLGSLVALLWVTHGRTASRDKLREWLKDFPEHDRELHQAISVIREGLVLGYTNDNERDRQVRQRCQQFARWSIEAAARDLEAYFALTPDDGRNDTRLRERATLSAKLLDHTGDQLYFASGAFRSNEKKRHVLPTLTAKKAFLDDVEPMLRRIGDVGTPSTIHNLVELLTFLLSADPARVFDLSAHALLHAGRSQGYQFESLAADQVVKMIGQFLADHRELFEDDSRRRTLVQCLDAFIEAGWPSARRLLYQLPELLQ